MVFTAVAFSSSFFVPFDNIIIDVIYGALIALVLWFVIDGRKVLQRNKTLASCLVSGPDFSGQTFIYKDKTYDQKLYVSSRMKDLEDYRGNQAKILGRLSYLRGKQANGGDAAVLAQMDILALDKLRSQ